MSMDRVWRWIVAIVALIAIAALLAFARGAPEHGDATPPPAGAVVIVSG
jgi:hypothetical protein